MTRPRYRSLPHTGDVRIAVWGRDEEELLNHAVLGTVRVALGRPYEPVAQRRRPIRPWPDGLERRLVRSANEALFALFDRREVAVGVRLGGGDAELAVAPLPAGLQPEIEVKAVTYHALCPSRLGERLRVILTLDL